MIYRFDLLEDDKKVGLDGLHDLDPGEGSHPDEDYPGIHELMDIPSFTFEKRYGDGKCYFTQLGWDTIGQRYVRLAKQVGLDYVVEQFDSPEELGKVLVQDDVQLYILDEVSEHETCNH